MGLLLRNNLEAMWSVYSSDHPLPRHNLHIRHLGCANIEPILLFLLSIPLISLLIAFRSGVSSGDAMGSKKISR
jgi:hypothetical protein